MSIPHFTSARVESAELTEVEPTPYRADLVILMARRKAVLAIVLEARRAQWRKRAPGPTCLASLRARCAARRCSSWSLRTERWPDGLRGPLISAIQVSSSGRWSSDRRPCPSFHRRRWPGRHPELAVLSAMAHGQEKVGLEIGRAAYRAFGKLDDQRSRLYFDLAFTRLNAAAKAALGDLMIGNYEYQSDFARKYYGQGLREGQQEEARAALMEVLDVRGLKPSLRVRKRIDACADVVQLKRWLRRAAAADSVAQVFGRLRAATRPASARRPRRS